MTAPDLRVFVNDRGYALPRGSLVRDAVQLAAPDLLAGADAGAVLVTDARGLPAALDLPLAAGAILRVQRSARRAAPDAPEADAAS